MWERHFNFMLKIKKTNHLIIFIAARLCTMYHWKQYNGNAFNVNKQTSRYWFDDFKTSNASGK